MLKLLLVLCSTKQRDKQLLMLCGRAASGQDTTNVARQQVTVITAKQLLTLRGRAAPLFLLQSMFSAVGVELNVSELKSGRSFFYFLSFSLLLL